jgi:hypothetical protein
MQSINIRLYHHVQQGEASKIISTLSKLIEWGASLTTIRHSTGVMIEVTVSERGKINFEQLHLPPLM